jgi:hypothetical protein
MVRMGLVKNIYIFLINSEGISISIILLFKPDGNCIWDGSEQFEANGHEQKDEHNYLCSKISENP